MCAQRARPAGVGGGLGSADRNRAHPRLDRRPRQIDMEQPVLEPRAAHLDALGEDERALKLTRRDPAVQIDALGIVGLFAADHQLVVLDRNAQIGHREAGDREGDAQLVFAELLDVVGRIAVAGDLVDPVERPLEMLEPQEQRRVEQRHARHHPSPRRRARSAAGPRAAPGNGSTNSIVDLGTPQPPVKQPLVTASPRNATAGAPAESICLLPPRRRPIFRHQGVLSRADGEMIMSRRSAPQPLLGRILEWRILLLLFFCAALALAPSLAEARAGSSSSGGGSSFGSRGTRTFDNNGAAPLSRSMTQTPSATSPLAGAGAGAGAMGGSFFQRHPFLSGLAGGFLGSMLFSGMGGFGHMFGGSLTILIIGFLIFFVIRLFSGRGFSFAGAGGGMPRSVGAAAAPSPQRYRGHDTTVGDADLNAFQGIHGSTQEAWGRGDLGKMRQLMTPEMLSYFNEELTRNTSQGVQNVVSDVRLLKGEITESWEEGDLQYATAFMKWSAIDYVARL